MSCSLQQKGRMCTSSEPASTCQRQLSRVERVKREQLLDSIAEGCGDVIEYAETAGMFIYHRDCAGVFHAIDCLIEKVLAVGAAAVDLRKLLATPTPADR